MTGASASDSARTVAFGEYTLELAPALLCKNGKPVDLSPQPLRVLVLLASRPGELVSRETIQKELWGEGIHVDFQHGLNSCIRQIRAALRDEARAWRYVETVHRRGYRFHIPASPARREPRFGKWRLVAAVAIATSTLAIAGYATISRRRSVERARAHDLVVEGRLLSSRLAHKNAKTHFEKALTFDPRSAEAHAGLALADVSIRRGLNFGGDARIGDGEREAKAALALDANSPDAHVATAALKYRFGQDWPGAERELRRAVSSDPGGSMGHGHLGEFLRIRGRFEESEAEIRKALELDPQSVWLNYQLACTKYYGRDYEAAIAQSRRTLEMDARYAPAHQVLGLALLACRQYEEAIAELEQTQYGPSGNLGNAYAIAGRRAEALQVLDHLKSRHQQDGVGAGEIARVYVGLEDFRRALDWIEAEASRGSSLPMVRIAPTFDPLRNDPRFQEILRKADLTQ